MLFAALMVFLRSLVLTTMRSSSSTHCSTVGPLFLGNRFAEAKYYAKYAVGSYGWLLAVYAQPSQLFCCRLCDCCSCTPLTKVVNRCLNRFVFRPFPVAADLVCCHSLC